MAYIKAAILDIDGTLLLSNDAHAKAFAEAGEKLGISVEYAKVRGLIGKGGDKILPEVFGIDSESERGKKLTDLKGEIFKKMLPGLKPAPGARALLERLRDDGIKLVIATSAGKEDVKPLLKQAGVVDLIEGMTSSDDAESSKPDPDIVVAALDKARVDAKDAVMVGDTPYDVEAASRAGVAIIAVRCGGWGDADLRGARAIYDDPAGILAHYEDSGFEWHGSS